jgi:glycerol-3-phosphate dehydrogenase
MKTRKQVIELASLREFDLVVIGAGIVGAGIAQDAAARGLSVIVIDKDDFASGTSSRTTKLIHGGLRYLQTFQLRLTRELCQERALLEQLAPHLVRDFFFVLPIIKGQFWLQLKAALGLTIYDLLSLSAVSAQTHKHVSRREVIESAPALTNSNVVGGLKFHDAITDDSRLVIEVLKSACAHGALAANYLEATGFGIADRKVNYVTCRDRYSNQEVTLRAKAFVNATGVWTDEVTRLADKRWGNRVLPAKGIHIMVPPSAFETNSALFLPNTDNRFVFVVPWQRALMIGTTDSLYSGNLNHPMANGDEVDYLLNAVNNYNGQRRLNRSDVIATWAGLRPLSGANDAAAAQAALTQASAPKNGNSKSSRLITGNISREYEVFEGPCGLIGVLGGKLTNYRIMANRVVEMVLAKFPQIAGPQAAVSRTRRIMLGGWQDKQDFLTQTAALAAKARKLFVEPATIDHLIASYGRDAHYVLEIIEQEPYLNERICPDFPPIMAEVAYCLDKEMAVSLEDVLSRRIRLAQLHHKQCLQAAPKVARLIQKLLGWDNARVTAELSALEYSLSEMTQSKPAI